jgi:hypothetical protein
MDTIATFRIVAQCLNQLHSFTYCLCNGDAVRLDGYNSDMEMSLMT